MDALSRKYSKHNVFLGSSFQAMKGSQHLTGAGASRGVRPSCSKVRRGGGGLGYLTLETCSKLRILERYLSLMRHSHRTQVVRLPPP